MLVLTRKPGEKICIGNDITVTVVEATGQRVRLAFEAPRKVAIMRAELLGRDSGGTDPDAKPQELVMEWETPGISG